MKSIITKFFDPDEIIFFEEEESFEMYIIISGQVRIYKTINNNKEMDIAILGPGQVIGEMSLISRAPRSATAIAVGEVNCKVINEKNFKNSTSGIPPWTMSLAKVVVQRLRNINSNIGEMIFTDSVSLKRMKLKTKADPILFNIEVKKEHPDIVFLKGHFFKNNTDDLNNKINELIRYKINVITLDFSDIIDIDTDAIEFVCSKLAQLKKNNIKINILNIQLIYSKVEDNKAFQKVIQEIEPPLKTVAYNQYLIKQNEPADCLYIVKQGRFKVTRNVKGVEKDFAEVGVGGVVGELAIIAGGRRMASVKALTHSKVYTISTEEFHSNKFNIPQWFLTILKQLVARIQKAGDKFDEICQV